MRKNIITINNVSFSYSTESERIDIFQNLNLEFKQGGLVVIFGESGSGKSSLLNMIAGFIKPNSGDVINEDIVVNKLSEAKACEYRNGKIGFIYQSFNLIPKLTAKENIMLPHIIRGNKIADAHTKADSLMERFKIDHRKNHFPYQLSGGEQQRIAIARALMNDPPIILADEPTGNLDSKNTENIKELLKTVADSNKTVIIVTHDQSFKEVADSVIDMHDLTT